MKIESPPGGFEALQKALEGAEIFNYGHLPAAAAYCRRLGLVETVNSIVSSQMNIPPGVVVQAMVLDTLSGRLPLYRLKEFLAEQDVELLTGDDLPAEAFSDVNVGRSLDAIFEAGASKIVTALGILKQPMHLLSIQVLQATTQRQSIFGGITAIAKMRIHLQDP